MRSAPFSASVRIGDGGTLIDLSGDIDRAAGPAFDQAYVQAATGKGGLILNFSGVGYINSTGIALIVGFLAKARAAQKVVSAYGLNEHYREIFSITRLSDFMGIYDDEDAALAAAS